MTPPDPGDKGFWSFMVVAILFLFIAYVAGRGELGAWVRLLIPAPAAAPKVQGAGQAPSDYGSGAKAPEDTNSSTSGGSDKAMPAWPKILF